MSMQSTTSQPYNHLRMNVEGSFQSDGPSALQSVPVSASAYSYSLFLAKLTASLDMQVALARSSIDLCSAAPDSSLTKAMDRLSQAVNFFRLEIESSFHSPGAEALSPRLAVDSVVPRERSSREYQDLGQRTSSRGASLQVPLASDRRAGKSPRRGSFTRDIGPVRQGSDDTNGVHLDLVDHGVPENQLQLRLPTDSKLTGRRPSEDAQVIFLSSNNVGNHNVKFDDSVTSRGADAGAFRGHSFAPSSSEAGMAATSHSTIATTARLNRMDSLLSTAMQVEETPKVRCPDGTINPNWGARMMWDLFVIALVLVDAMVLPFQMAYTGSSDSAVDKFWLYLTTIFFAVDIVLNFSTAFPAGNNDPDYEPGKLVTNRIKIARNYLRTWFSIDFVSTIPWGVLADLAADGDSGGGAQLTKLTKAIKFVRFLRLMRMLRLAKLGVIWERIEARLGSLALLQTIALLRVMFILTAICHWNACIWWIIGQPEDSILTDMMTHETLDQWKGMVHWTTIWHTTAAAGAGSEADLWRWLDRTNNEAYIFCFYWTLGVMRTMPAEVQPVNRPERVYVMVFMFFAFSIFAISIAQITGTYFKISSRRREFNEEMAFVRMYLRRIGASQDTQDKVKAFLRHMFDSRQIIDTMKFIHEAEKQPVLATQLSLARFGRHLQRIDFLKGIDVKKLQPLTDTKVVKVSNILPGEILCIRRMPAKAAWILLSGRLAKIDDQSGEKLEAKSSAVKGKRQGPCEIVDTEGLLSDEPMRSMFTIRASTCCSLLRIDKEAFREAVESSPELAQSLLGKNDVQRAPRQTGAIAHYPAVYDGQIPPHLLVPMSTAAAIHA